ncbi:MAG: hypothetical protein IJ980_06625 [Oscillospiraceae bacterium]|nr:hypothetical protein [Oscillospiraceae bacterium]
MKRIFTGAAAVWLPLLLAGCDTTRGGLASITIIYGAAALLSLVLLIGCCVIDRKRDVWFLLLFSSVLVVNIGYFALSSSRSLEGALMANRIAYLGSVFLPPSMLMIILNVTDLRCKKQLPPLLLILAAVVFLVAASPGILVIYYKEATLVTVDGVSALQKVYGPLHGLYGLHLLLYFVAMVAVIIHAYVKRKLESTGHAVILAIAVFVNICVWFLEQLGDINFEFLSVSYIISELFLLGLHLMVSEQQRLRSLVTEKEQALADTAKALREAVAETQPQPTDEEDAARRAKLRRFAEGIPELTQTEAVIFRSYIARMSTKEVLAALNIKENTLKFHNKNLYQKLGVSSRKELLELHKQLQTEDAPL